MKAAELLELFADSGKRAHLIGTTETGVIVGLDLEGRLYAIYQSQVINRINPEAITKHSVLDMYHNPGGDGLWPAPEGTRAGYWYSTGGWRVPIGIRQARFQLSRSGPGHSVIQSEADLINSRGTGIPLLLERDIQVKPGKRELEVIVTESIQYLGTTPLDRNTGLLAPWSLCQFDCGPGCEVVFPATREDVWDLYDADSWMMRYWEKDLCHTKTDGLMRYQIGMGKAVPWIEYRDPMRKMRVIRQATPLEAGMTYIDIRDASSNTPPSPKGVRYSVYSDSNGFMEIEAVGGAPEVILPQTKLTQEINTRYLFG